MSLNEYTKYSISTKSVFCCLLFVSDDYIGRRPCVLAVAGLDTDEIVVQGAGTIVLQESHLSLMVRQETFQRMHLLLVLSPSDSLSSKKPQLNSYSLPSRANNFYMDSSNTLYTALHFYVYFNYFLLCTTI